MELFQPLFIVCLLAALCALLWKSKRGVAWFSPQPRRRMELLDRVSLTHQHSVHLLRVEGRWMAVAVTPKGVELLESGSLPTEEPASVASSFSAALGSATLGGVMSR